MIDHDAVLKLARCRLRPKDIAARLNLTTPQVYHSLTRWRKQGEDIPRFSLKSVKQPKRRVPIPVHVRDLLEPHAQARRTGVFDLAETLLTVVAEENMVDAILDDGVRS